FLEYVCLYCFKYTVVFISLPYHSLFLFFFYSSDYHRDLHSFPTRRSSDLVLIEATKQIYAKPVAVRTPRRRLVYTPAPHGLTRRDRKSTRLNSSHEWISYAVFCLKKKKKQ